MRGQRVDLEAYWAAFGKRVQMLSWRQDTFTGQNTPLFLLRCGALFLLPKSAFGVSANVVKPDLLSLFDHHVWQDGRIFIKVGR